MNKATMNKETHPFCSSCKIFGMCLGNPDDVIKTTQAYLCIHCKKVMLSDKRGLTQTAVCGLLYGSLADAGRTGECKSEDCVERGREATRERMEKAMEQMKDLPSTPPGVMHPSTMPMLPDELADPNSPEGELQKAMMDAEQKVRTADKGIDKALDDVVDKAKKVVEQADKVSKAQDATAAINMVNGPGGKQ